MIKFPNLIFLQLFFTICSQKLQKMLFVGNVADNFV